METRDELLITCNSIKTYVKMSVSDEATSLHHCLKNKQLKINMLSEVRIQVFSVMHS